MTKGDDRETILEELGKDYHRSPRQIERYISEIHQQQMEKLAEQKLRHISKLQELARTTIESYKAHMHLPPLWIAGYRVVPAATMVDFETSFLYQQYDSAYLALGKLTGDAYWTPLAEHLGSEAQQISGLVEKFEDAAMVAARNEAKLTSKKLTAMINEATNLLNGRLAVVAICADRREWEHQGISWTCRFCVALENQEYKSRDHPGGETSA